MPWRRRAVFASILFHACVLGSAIKASRLSSMFGDGVTFAGSIRHNEDRASVTSAATTTTAASHGRRLAYWKSKCHQAGRWTFRLGVAVDRGFVKKCDPDASDKGCKTRVKEMLKSASNLFNENFGIQIEMASWISPARFEDSDLLKESPDSTGSCPLIPISSAKNDAKRRVEIFEQFRKGNLADSQEAAWLLLTDCGATEGKVTLGMAYEGFICSTQTQVLVVRYQKKTEQSARSTWVTLAHELGHLFGIVKHREGSIMSYNDKLTRDGDMQFHPDDDDIVCDVIEHSVGIKTNSVYYPDRRTIERAKCAVLDPSIPFSGPTFPTSSTTLQLTAEESRKNGNEEGESSALVVFLIVCGVCLCCCAMGCAAAFLVLRRRNRDKDFSHETKGKLLTSRTGGDDGGKGGGKCGGKGGGKSGGKGANKGKGGGKSESPLNAMNSTLRTNHPGGGGESPSHAMKGTLKTTTTSPKYQEDTSPNKSPDDSSPKPAKARKRKKTTK